MNYRAACPHCTSVFRLGDDQLAVAQGWVQCGVCGAAFDARLSLLMENGSALPLANEPEPVAMAPAPEPVPEQLAEPAPAEALPSSEAAAAPAPVGAGEPEETEAEAEAGTPEPLESAEAEVPHPAEMPRGIREREDALDLPSIILIDPNLPTYDEPGPLPVIKVEEPEMPAPEPVAIAAAPAVTFSPPPGAHIEYAHPGPGPARVPAGQRRLKPWIWIVAGVLLLIALAAQTAYFLRDTLASQLPQTRPALEQACALLGCSLSLPRDLDQLQIVGSDLHTEAGGRLRLVLTLGNQAAHVQAWPVLVLTLTDQAGRPLARRSFAPSEYLGDADRIAAGMPPRSEQPLNLPLTVHDIAPMGFDLRLTY